MEKPREPQVPTPMCTEGYARVNPVRGVPCR